MTAETGNDDARRRAHEMLLRLAGRVPDDLLWQAREWLADGAYGEMAAVVAFVVALGVPASSCRDDEA